MRGGSKRGRVLHRNGGEVASDTGALAELLLVAALASAATA
jgi:hypothetical protein